MGNSVIWFLPHGSDRYNRIDLGKRIKDRPGPQVVYRQSVQQAINGRRTSVIYHGLSQIRLRHTWSRDAAGTGDLLRRKLQMLIAHLQRGGTCLFTEDEIYARAGFATELPTSETASVTVDLDLFISLATNQTSSAGRELWVNTDHDTYLCEHKLCSAFSGTTFTFAQNIAQDMSGARWVLVRDYGSYPALRLPAEFLERGDFLVHDREWLFELDLPLEEAPDVLDTLFDGGSPFPGTEPGPIPIDVSNPEINYGGAYLWDDILEKF